MGFDIPEPYCWDESFRVFYESLDEQHRGLFKGIFDCAATPGCGKTLENLVKIVKEHFTTEEGMMEKSGYGELDEHRGSHTDFVAKLESLKAPLGTETINYAKDWLVNHIKGTDFKYKGKLVETAIAE